MISYFSELLVALVPSFKFAIPWTILTFVLIPILWTYFPKVDKWYKEQNYEKQLDWNARTTAAFHAAGVFILIFWAMMTEDDFTHKDVFSTSPLVRWTMECSIGYFLSDSIVLYQLRKYYGSDTVAYAGHHIVSIFGLAQTIKGGAAMWFTALRLCTELSTPFVNINFMLTLLKMEDTMINTINRHISFWTFMVCRPCLMPIFWYYTILHMLSGDFWRSELPTQFVWVIAGLGLDILNIIWTKTITIGYYNWIREDTRSYSKLRTQQSCKNRQTG